MKKELLSILLILLPLMACAETVEINGIWYNLLAKAKKAEVTRNPNTYKYSGDIKIPETVKHDGELYTVTIIGDYAFSNSNDLSVTIPNTVTTIGRGAFSYCRNLISITIPPSVTSIEDEAFFGSEGPDYLNILCGDKRTKECQQPSRPKHSPSI